MILYVDAPTMIVPMDGESSAFGKYETTAELANVGVLINLYSEYAHSTSLYISRRTANWLVLHSSWVRRAPYIVTSSHMSGP